MFNAYIGIGLQKLHITKLQTLSVCTLLQSMLSANKIPRGRKRKTITYMLITACFCCYLNTSGLIKYTACSHLAPKLSKKEELDTSPLKQTIENI